MWRAPAAGADRSRGALPGHRCVSSPVGLVRSPSESPHLRTSMIPNDFIQTLLSRVDIVDVIDRNVPLKKAGANYQALLPVPQREDAVVHRQPDQAVLSLLRLRRARHGHRVPDGARRQVVSRSRRGAGARRRPRGAARRAAGERERRERSASTSPRSLLEAAKVLPRAAEGSAARDRLPQAARASPAQIAARFGIGYAPDGWQTLAAAFPDYDDPRSTRRDWSSPAKAASATTASATASCSRSTIAAAG